MTTLGQYGYVPAAKAIMREVGLSFALLSHPSIHLIFFALYSCSGMVSIWGRAACHFALYLQMRRRGSSRRSQFKSSGPFCFEILGHIDQVSKRANHHMV